MGCLLIVRLSLSVLCINLSLVLGVDPSLAHDKDMEESPQEGKSEFYQSLSGTCQYEHMNLIKLDGFNKNNTPECEIFRDCPLTTLAIRSNLTQCVHLSLLDEPLNISSLTNIALIGFKALAIKQVKWIFSLPALPALVNLTLDRIFALDQEADFFQNITDLKILTLTDSRLPEIPPTWISSWMSLTDLDLSNNALTSRSIPSLEGLKSLKYLNLAHNKIHDQLPKLPSSLELLILRENQITDLNDIVFTGLNQLKWLDLSGNSIHTMHEATFSLLPQILKIYMKRSNVSSLGRTLQERLCNMTLLESFDLDNNPISCQCIIDCLKPKVVINTASCPKGDTQDCSTFNLEKDEKVQTRANTMQTTVNSVFSSDKQIVPTILPGIKNEPNLTTGPNERNGLNEENIKVQTRADTLLIAVKSVFSSNNESVPTILRDMIDELNLSTDPMQTPSSVATQNASFISQNQMSSPNLQDQEQDDITDPNERNGLNEDNFKGTNLEQNTEHNKEHSFSVGIIASIIIASVMFAIISATTCMFFRNRSRGTYVTQESTQNRAIPLIETGAI